MINKALKKHEELLTKKIRHEIGTELKGLLNITKTRLVEDQRKVNNKYDSFLTKLKDSISQQDIVNRTKIDILESQSSSIMKRQESIDQEFQEQIDINRKVKQSQVANEKSIKEFMKKLQVDYMDFFRDKTKMRQELTKQLCNIQEFEEKTEQVILNFTSKLQHHRKLLQLLSEANSYISNIVS